MSIKIWSNAVQTFSGNTSAIWLSLNANRDYLFNLHVQLARELKDRTVLYTQDIEEKYKRINKTRGGVKKRKITPPTADDYLRVLFSDKDFFRFIESPIARMTIYFAADIPWALDNEMPLETFKQFVGELLLRSQKALVAHGDPVGIVAAQSASERFTQTTLNSVDWETCMAIRWVGTHPPPAPPDGPVGEFIDALMGERSHLIQIQPDGVTEYLPLGPNEATALSVDKGGNVVWTTLEAVTRHPVINDDGTNTLLRFKTTSGHEVVSTKGESMLRVKGDDIFPVRGDSIKVGDNIPMTASIPPPRHEHLDLRTIFKKTEFVFTDIAIHAASIWKNEPGWYYKNFTNKLPYSKSTTFRDVVYNKRPHLLKRPAMVALGGSEQLSDEEVMLPVKMLLYADFGFFLGAYLAKGCVDKFQVIISNSNREYRNRIILWLKRQGICSYVVRGSDILISCRILTSLVSFLCGVGSCNKRVPSFTLCAPPDFIRGLLDAYFTGDGGNNEKGVYLSTTSMSKNLIEGISHLMTRFNIPTRLSQINCGKEKICYIINTMCRGETMKTQDIHHQGIKSIEEVTSPHPRVYDLTVSGTRNMCTMGGIHVRDSFHYAGIKKSVVTGGIDRIKQLLSGTKSLNVPILGPILTSSVSDPTMLVERLLGYYCEESGVIYKVSDDENFSNFCIFLKLKNINTWKSIIRDKLPVSYKRDSYVDGDTVFIKFTTKHTVDDIKGVYAKLIRSQVSGLKSCIEYDTEDKILVFAPKTSMVKTRLMDKSMYSKIDNSEILDHCPDIDLTKMFSNDIYYIQTTLGIAAAEYFIFKELKNVLGNEGINLNPAHISLMAAKMTSTGSITPNTFSGVNLEDSVILKATFQESTKTFAHAAFNNYTDHINDVSSQIMTGMQPRIGTQRIGWYYKDVGNIIEKEFHTTPEYAPLSPEYVELPDNYDMGLHTPQSPTYAPASPAYYVDGELPEPKIDI
jgi:intein/homing endonuclease